MQIQKVHGTHNGIQLITNENDQELYYSTKSKTCAVGVKGIARMLKCDTKTVSRKVVTSKLGQEAELYTKSGIRTVTFIKESDLNTLFSEMLNSRIKETTKDRIREVQNKYVQAGFRLSVMLRVAPEEVAKEVIKHIIDPQKVEEVRAASEDQAKYLETFWGLGDEIKATGASYGAIHGHNNDLVDLEKGTRPQMSDYQRDALAFIQHAEKMKLKHNKEKYKNGYHATNSAKKAGTQAQEALSHILT